jgi:hypothetical protein
VYTFRDLLNFEKSYVLNSIKRILGAESNQVSLFFDLSPVDNADPNGIYTRALNEAMENANIQNIALTGPYGSGKTSIIRTFEKSSKFKFLKISLATFSDPKTEDRAEDKAADKVAHPISGDQIALIERSILQQMLYGAEANKIPYSRFKRITIPKWLEVKALIFSGWLALIFFTYSNKDSLSKKIDLADPNWLWVSILLFVFLVAAYLFSIAYKATHSLSIKKLSLHNGEVEMADLSENSVLNRHIDEIIYFFESTKYDLVVIEDLDRFGSPEIFIKLREINKLINDRRARAVGIGKFKWIKQPIKFLYAIKDDMFDNKSRAKFFDFIVPVIPIINSSNSKEKILERLKEVKFNSIIDSQFIKEVSLYVDDMRLINNIVNEFVVYESKLGSESLNRTKLLAIIIYKNMYPSDFEALHHSKGALFAICELRLTLLRERRASIEKEVGSIRAELTASQSEVAASAEELVKIFWAHISTYDPNRFLLGIEINGSPNRLNDLLDWNQFSQLFSQGNLRLSVLHNGYNQNVSLGKSFLDVQKEINSKLTFQQRKNAIDNKMQLRRKDFIGRLDELTKENLSIPKEPLYELINRSGRSLEDVVSSDGISAPELLFYLIRNGYLDETYYLYTSNFHEGSLSKRDRDFLLAIRDFKVPDPTQAIDTPREVCDEMRVEDFEHEYALNVYLIDYLLTTNNYKHKKISSVVKFISENFSKTKGFFSAYWAEGKNIEALTKAISQEWADYAAAAIDSNQAVEHTASMIAFVDPDYLDDEMDDDGKLSAYISDNAGLIFSASHVSINDYSALKALGVQISNLSDILEFSNLFDFVHVNDLYKITLDNVLLILNRYPRTTETPSPNAELSNYTAIRTYGSADLNRRVASDFSEYINSVFLLASNNTEEAGEYVKEILNKEELTEEQKIAVINKQNYVFTSFEGIPESLWESVLLEEKIEITWGTIMACFNCDECDRDVITSILNIDHIVDVLSATKISKEVFGEEPSLELSRFIFKNDTLSGTHYRSLCCSLSHEFVDFPNGIAKDKLIALVETKVVKLNDESFNFSEDDEELRICLIVNNLQEYFTNESNYVLSDKIKEGIVFSNVEGSYKIKISRFISPSAVAQSRRLSKLISEFISLPHAKISDFEESVVSSCVINSGDTRTSILILSKVIGVFSNADVLTLLSQLPEPYAEISIYGKNPKLPKTDENFALASLLERHEIISLVKDEGDHIRIYTFKSAKDD